MINEVNKPLKPLERINIPPVADQYFNNGLLHPPPSTAWQVCPLCKGKGFETTFGPFMGSSSRRDNSCTVCNGRKIISTLTGLPPVSPSNTTFTNGPDHPAQTV